MAIPDPLKELSEQIGFGKAFARLYATLPETIWDELTFKQCVDICLNTHSDKLRLRATKRMKDIGSFDDWRNGFYTPLRNNIKLLLTCVSHMAHLAGQNGKANHTLRVVKDAYAIGRLLEDFVAIGKSANNHLRRIRTARDQ